MRFMSRGSNWLGGWQQCWWTYVMWWANLQNHKIRHTLHMSHTTRPITHHDHTCHTTHVIHHTCHTSHYTCHTLHLSHVIHVTHHTSYTTRHITHHDHTTHVIHHTCHTSHITRHTCHITHVTHHTCTFLLIADLRSPVENSQMDHRIVSVYLESLSLSGLSWISQSKSNLERSAAGSWMFCSADFLGLYRPYAGLAAARIDTLALSVVMIPACYERKIHSMQNINKYPSTLDAIDLQANEKLTE